MPRILPLVGVALAGVIAVKALSGVTALPDVLQGAKAFAEGVVKPAGAPGAVDKSGAPVLPPGLSPAPGSPAAIAAAAQSKPPPVPLACGPKAADLAREAGMSPAELQILQSLGARRGQLDQREQDIDAQTQLLTAAEAKLDAKLAALGQMKGSIQALLNQSDAQKQAEIDRLVIVYSKMKPKDAAARMTLINDAVRLPIAAKMKEAALSAILGQMAPADAKDLTEKLAHRFETQALADARAAMAGPGGPAAVAANAATSAAASANAANASANAAQAAVPGSAPPDKAVVAANRRRAARAARRAIAANAALKADTSPAGATAPPFVPGNAAGVPNKGG